MPHSWSFSTCRVGRWCFSAATSSGSEVYFDNSKYGWKDVYVYAYGTKENAEWPGELSQKSTAVFIRQALRLLLNLGRKSSSTTVLKKAMARSSILRQQVFH